MSQVNAAFAGDKRVRVQLGPEIAVQVGWRRGDRAIVVDVSVPDSLPVNIREVECSKDSKPPK